MLIGDKKKKKSYRLKSDTIQSPAPVFVSIKYTVKLRLIASVVHSNRNNSCRHVFNFAVSEDVGKKHVGNNAMTVGLCYLL